MRWGEFKVKMESLGVCDEDELWYLDLHPMEFLALKYGHAVDGSPLGWAVTDGFDEDGAVDGRPGKVISKVVSY